MSKPIYIHYGSDNFDPDKFIRPLTNCWGCKPSRGGLWASREDAKFGWKDWCVAEEFYKNDFSKSFRFTLRDNANVIHLIKNDDIDKLSLLEKFDKDDPFGWVNIDFGSMIENGVDAIELHLSENRNKGGDYRKSLYWTMYGWDCDSILILNKDIIELI